MVYSIGCDMHKRYSVFAALDAAGVMSKPVRVAHEADRLRQYFAQVPPGTPVAFETTGHWHWFADLLEEVGMVPKLTDARKAKVMMGHTNKTDPLDAQGLATLLHNGTLPAVWIPPREVRDQRELLRWRMAFVRQRTGLKNRVHATLAKYAVRIEEVSDLFGPTGRRLLALRLSELPPHTRACLEQHLDLLDVLGQKIAVLESRIDALITDTPRMAQLQSLPGVGRLLSALIAVEAGTMARFPSASHYASYAGTTPTVHSSGGTTHYGHVRKDVNQYLKWAYVEAANVIVSPQRSLAHTHVGALYERLKRRKGHGTAVVAVARHLAEATYWMWRKEAPYREPKRPQSTVSSTPGQARVMS
jgi:transposase